MPMALRRNIARSGSLRRRGRLCGPPDRSPEKEAVRHRSRQVPLERFLGVAKEVGNEMLDVFNDVFAESVQRIELQKRIARVPFSESGPDWIRRVLRGLRHLPASRYGLHSPAIDLRALGREEVYKNAPSTRRQRIRKCGCNSLSALTRRPRCHREQNHATAGIGHPATEQSAGYASHGHCHTWGKTLAPHAERYWRPYLVPRGDVHGARIVRGPPVWSPARRYGARSGGRPA